MTAYPSRRLPYRTKLPCPVEQKKRRAITAERRADSLGSFILREKNSFDLRFGVFQGQSRAWRGVIATIQSYLSFRGRKGSELPGERTSLKMVYKGIFYFRLSDCLAVFPNRRAPFPQRIN